MKTICKIMTMLILSALTVSFLTASAEQQEPFLLWGLSYNYKAAYVKTLVEEERGIICDYTYYPKSKLLPAYGIIKSTNDEDLSLYGYPYRFTYTDNPGVYRLQLKINGTRDEQRAALDAVVSGLVGKYSLPDSATVELYSHGGHSWVLKQAAAVHEIQNYDINNVSTFDAEAFYSQWPYTQTDSEITLHLRFYNISFDAYFYEPGKDYCYFDICFYRSQTKAYEPTFDELTDPKPTAEPSPSDGF